MLIKIHEITFTLYLIFNILSFLALCHCTTEWVSITVHILSPTTYKVLFEHGIVFLVRIRSFFLVYILMRPKSKLYLLRKLVPNRHVGTYIQVL